MDSVERSDAAIVDTLTTLYTRSVLDLALEKECHRAGRFGRWLSVVLMDVDRLAAINQTCGYGVGDRVLERIGILVRSSCRHQDWVARYDEDSIALLLPETAPDGALSLAESTRTMISERLTFRDHRTDEDVVVSVSIAVVNQRGRNGSPIDADRIIAVAEEALARAKQRGGNCIEQVELSAPAAD
jgi:diguanylate cyclase